MSVTFDCIVPADPTDERLWKAYLEKHGCLVSAAHLQNGTPYYKVTLPAGCPYKQIGGALEPVYRLTLPDGATLIEYALRMRAEKLVVVGLPEEDWKAWRAENEQAT